MAKNGGAKAIAILVGAGALLTGGVVGGVKMSEQANETKVEQAREEGYQAGIEVNLGHTDEEMQEAIDRAKEEGRQEGYQEGLQAGGSGGEVETTALSYEFNEDSLEASVLASDTTIKALNIPAQVTHNGQTYSVTSVAENGFKDCTSLKEVVIPDTIVEVRSSAFENCTALEKITISKKVMGLGTSAFAGCTSLTEINFNAEAMADFYAGNNIFANAGTSKGGIVVNIGEDVTKLPAYLFNSTNSDLTSPYITKVNFAENTKCESIGNYVFAYCTHLTNLTLADSVGTIGESAFFYCTRLETMTLSQNLKQIKTRAFYYAGLNDIVIPASVQTIERSAFSRSSLTMVTFEDVEKWMITGTGWEDDGTILTLPDLTTNAEYLVTTYSSYDWVKQTSVSGETVDFQNGTFRDGDENFEEFRSKYFGWSTLVDQVPYEFNGEVYYIEMKMDENLKPIIIVSWGGAEAYSVKKVGLETTDISSYKLGDNDGTIVYETGEDYFNIFCMSDTGQAYLQYTVSTGELVEIVKE